MKGFQTKDNNKLCRVGLGCFFPWAIAPYAYSCLPFPDFFSFFISNKKQKRELSNDKES